MPKRARRLEKLFFEVSCLVPDSAKYRIFADQSHNGYYLQGFLTQKPKLILKPALARGVKRGSLHF
jgi:hypothetical protein